jgi:predicted glycogen debranching enzyme
MSVPGPIVVPGERLHDFETGSRLEWIETDGRGGYASGTAVGANTRRYHGVLVVARRPPTDRVILLSRLEEAVHLPDGRSFELGANVYPDAVHPRGYRCLESFRLDPWPIWRYRLGGVELTKALFLARRPGAVVVMYRVSGGPAVLEVRPLVAGRDFHSLIFENDGVAARAEAAPGCIAYRPYPGIPPLVISHTGGEWRDTGFWYRQTVYPRETERGLDDREDLYNPGILTARLEPDRPWILACGTSPVAIGGAAGWAAEERARQRRAAERGGALGVGDPRLAELGARLAVAAEDFVVSRDGERTIIAGYPWFADWGRDAMISIPGLFLTMGRTDLAASVLRTFATHLRDGLIPNRFPDHGGDVPDDHYNAADAPLWFVEAVGALADAGGEAGEFWPAVREIVEAYRRGTRFGIRMEDDGLVRQGEPGVQLTWMDAKVDGWVVTPRDGKAVEINALWYNALRRTATLAGAAGGDPGRFAEDAERVRAAFAAFWYEEGRYLYDRIDDEGRPDASLRPNQLFAAALPHAPIDLDRARGVVAAVERELVVPLGVRTLAPSDPHYKGHYGGTREERDAAYHCGTAWPWLLGPFIRAYLRVHGGAAARARARDLLAPVLDHLGEEGLGHVSEVVAGDRPHTPGGCFAQAWSCAELLRAIPLVAGAAPNGGPP